MMKFNKSAWDLICEQYRRGESAASLATKYGVCERSIYKRCWERGIELHRLQTARIGTDFEHNVIKLINRKLSYSEISARLGMSRNAVAGLVFRLKTAGAL